MTSPDTASSLNETKWNIELFNKEYNGWIQITLCDFNALFASKESFDMNNLHDYKIVSNSYDNSLIPKLGQYIEFQKEFNMSVEIDSNRNVKLRENPKKKLTLWVRGKVVLSLDDGSYLIEYNSKLYNQKASNIRMLSIAQSNTLKEHNLITWSTLFWPSVFEYINSELIKCQSQKCLLYYTYSSDKYEFNIITEKPMSIFLNEIIPLKQEECKLVKKFDAEIENEQKNLNKLNSILNSNLRVVMKYHIHFKQSIEKEVNAMNIQYTIVNSEEESNDNNNYFSLILYSKDQKQLNEAKEALMYQEDSVPCNRSINMNEIEENVNKTKIQHHYVTNNSIHLLGKEKNITAFKTLWKIVVKYNQEYQQQKTESDIKKKELSTLMKKYKMK